MKQLEQQLHTASKELETARACIAELEAQLAAAAVVDVQRAPEKSAVCDDRGVDALPEAAAAPRDTEIQQEIQQETASRLNPFRALGDIGLGDAASRLVALAGEHQTTNFRFSFSRRVCDGCCRRVRICGCAGGGLRRGGAERAQPTGGERCCGGGGGWGGGCRA